MRRLVTISYTGLHASGGVPAFNRALHAAFPDRECHHFCWTDFPWYDIIDRRGETEWGRARILNEYLVKSREITIDDVVVVDGFWGTGLFHLPLAVSHSHGIWSHLIHEDVQSGKQPDMPQHHAAQVDFRRRWTDARKHLTAVSSFIAREMTEQWGFMSDKVINNGVDTNIYTPSELKISRPRPIIIHGVNDPSNENKGWSHIQMMHGHLDADVLSLDEAQDRFSHYSDYRWTKPNALAQADLIVHPSGFEGNSIFIAEALACGVPVIGYDVGYLWGVVNELGTIIDRRCRSPETTLHAVQDSLENSPLMKRASEVGRKLALRDLSNGVFVTNWRSYIEEIENA